MSGCKGIRIIRTAGSDKPTKLRRSGGGGWGSLSASLAARRNQREIRWRDDGGTNSNLLTAPVSYRHPPLPDVHLRSLRREEIFNEIRNTLKNTLALLRVPRGYPAIADVFS
jgi:hypothetical protein